MLANQPKNDTLYIKGFNIVVENRAFTYRQVAQNVGQKACLMPAHYGYLQNNPKVGVFVGAFPENDTVYLINQKAQGGYFDKHIAMFGFLSEQQAVDTYQKCFEYGYIGLMSVVPCTIEQLKWWLINGDKSRPVTKERLPYAGLERLDSVLWCGEDKADLASHSGQVAKLLYQIRQSDNFNHALEPLSYHDLTQELGNQGFVYENYDALVIEYNKLERKAKQLLMAMQGAADIVKPVGVAVSKPLTKGGVANVVAWFEMDDGQAVGVFFHNPDKTPKKIDPTDEMISYKWVLNKKDITIVVAPENGKDLVVRTVAKRIMKLVDANHDRFLKANGAKAELNLKEQNLGQLVIEKQAELDALNKEIELLEAQKAEKENAIKENQVASQMENNQTNQEVNTPVTLTGKELENPTLPQERPSNWRTNLVNARAVAKSLGIETKGKKLSRLLREIDIFDEKEVKKELLSEFKALASRLVLPNGYVFDLSDAEKSIDDITRWVSPMIKQKGAFDFNKIRIELRAVTSINEYEGGVYISDYVFFYTEDKKAKAELDKLNYPNDGNINASEPKTPKATVEKMEQFLINAVFPKIEYLKVMNSTNKDVAEMPYEQHTELDARIDSLSPNELGYLGVILNYKTSDKQKIANDAKQEHPDDLKTALESLDKTMAQEAVRKKIAEIGKQPNRDDALALAVKFTKEMPSEAERIRTELYLAIAQNKWRGIEVKLPQQPPKLKTDAEVLASVKRLQKSFDGTEFRLNISKANTDYIRGVLIKGAGSSMSSQEFSYFNNKGFDLGYIEYGNQFDFDTFNPILKGIEKWLQGDIIPKFYVGTDVNWDMDSISTPLKIKEALDKALSEGLAMQQPSEPEPTPTTSEPVQPVSEPPMTNPDRDYLQSIIDGKDTGLEPKAITAKIRTIISTAKDGNDTDMLSLADQAAKAYAAQVKAKAAAKLAEVQ